MTTISFPGRNALSRVRHSATPKMYAKGMADFQKLGSEIKHWSKQAKQYPIEKGQTEPLWAKSFDEAVNKPQWHKTLAEVTTASLKKAMAALKPQLQKRETLLSAESLAQAAANEASFTVQPALAKLESMAAGMGKDSRVLYIGTAERPDSLAFFARHTHEVTAVLPADAHGQTLRALQKTGGAPIKNVRFLENLPAIQSFTHIVIHQSAPNRESVIRQLANSLSQTTTLILRNPVGLRTLVHDNIQPSEVAKDLAETGRLSVPGGIISILLRKRTE